MFNTLASIEFVQSSVGGCATKIEKLQQEAIHLAQMF